MDKPHLRHTKKPLALSRKRLSPTVYTCITQPEQCKSTPEPFRRNHPVCGLPITNSVLPHQPRCCDIFRLSRVSNSCWSISRIPCLAGLISPDSSNSIGLYLELGWRYPVSLSGVDTTASAPKSLGLGGAQATSHVWMSWLLSVVLPKLLPNTQKER